MVRYQKSENLSDELCKALGLDASNLTKLTVICEVGSVVRVITEGINLVQDEGTEHFTQTWELVEVEK